MLPWYAVRTWPDKSTSIHFSPGSATVGSGPTGDGRVSAGDVLVAVAVADGTAVCVDVGIGVCVDVRVGVWVAVGAAVCVLVAVAVGLGVEVVVTVGVGLTTSVRSVSKLLKA
jgi:hypothetical protein